MHKFFSSIEIQPTRSRMRSGYAYSCKTSPLCLCLPCRVHYTRTPAKTAFHLKNDAFAAKCPENGMTLH